MAKKSTEHKTALSNTDLHTPHKKSLKKYIQINEYISLKNEWLNNKWTEQNRASKLFHFIIIFLQPQPFMLDTIYSLVRTRVSAIVNIPLIYILSKCFSGTQRKKVVAHSRLGSNYSHADNVIMIFFLKLYYN